MGCTLGHYSSVLGPHIRRPAPDRVTMALLWRLDENRKYRYVTMERIVEHVRNIVIFQTFRGDV